jgi:hypothetical protein
MSAIASLETIDAVLEPCGFERKKMTWSRRGGSTIDVVELQVNKTLDAMTINAGVLDPEVYALVWNKPVQPPFEQPACTVAVRIGALLDGLDTWWPSNGAAAAAEVAEATRAVVVPFLERMRSREAMEQWLIDTRVLKKHYPLPIMHLALLKHLTGRTQEACEILDALIAGAWGEKATALKAQIGCKAKT